MSYLLTEIALEMMGYKYYDIDGTFGPTDFKHVGPPPPSQSNQNTEASLEQILGLAIDEEDAAAATSATAAGDANVADDASTGSQTPSADAATATTSAEAAPLPPPPPPSSGALVRLLDYEFCRIREQIQRNQTLYMQAHTDELKRIEQRGGCTPQEFLQPYVETERSNLQREVQTMHAFRKLVERNLVKMNPENFEKYMNTFRRNKRAMEKMGLPQREQPPKQRANNSDLMQE